MKVLLVTPENRFIRAFRRGQWNNFAQITMPYLAGFFPSRHQVELVDEGVKDVDIRVRADVVGITCNTPNALHVYELSKAFRERGCRVILGGPHPTILPQEAKEHADSVIIGEAEALMPEIIRDAEVGALKHYYQAHQAPELSNLPHIRRDLMIQPWVWKNALFATRGCPFQCSFCNLRQLYFPEPRFRHIAEVVAEVSSMSGPYFVFWDDHLFMDKAYALDLCKALKGVGKRWAAMVTLESTRDETLLRAASEGGCLCLFVGLESFSPKSLTLANKSFNMIEGYAEAVERIHRHGIAVQAGIVFGFDGDDESVFELTLRESLKLGLDGATVSILTPLPGTPVYESLKSQGRLLTEDWSLYDGKTAVTFRPAQMTPERLWQGYQWFRQQFFSRKGILARLRRSPVPKFPSWVLNMGYRAARNNVIPGHASHP